MLAAYLLLKYLGEIFDVACYLDMLIICCGRWNSLLGNGRWISIKKKSSVQIVKPFYWKIRKLKKIVHGVKNTFFYLDLLLRIRDIFMHHMKYAVIQ